MLIIINYMHHSLTHTINQSISQSEQLMSDHLHLFFSVVEEVVVASIEVVEAVEVVAKPIPVLPDLNRLDPHSATMSGINARRLPPEDSIS